MWVAEELDHRYRVYGSRRRFGRKTILKNDNFQEVRNWYAYN